MADLTPAEDVLDATKELAHDIELLGDSVARALETITELRALNAELVEALRAVVPLMPGPDARCHVGICDQSECGYCQRIAAARKALAKAGR